MKRNMTRLLSTLLVLCMALALLPGTALAADTIGGLGRDLIWSYSNGTLTFDGSGIIPDYDSSRPPWSDYSDDIRTIEISDGVTSIGNGAFFYCNNLTSVTIPDSVTSIGDYTFDQCNSLRSVTIPNSVRSIGESAFADCRSLTSVTIPRSVTVLSANVFARCENLASVTIPNGVTTIGESAFLLCSSLTSVTIPDSVTTIKKGAFTASGLTGVTVPNGVTAIEDDTFSDCRSLTSVTLPDGIRSIGNHAFSFCIALTGVNIPDGVTSIGDDAFFACITLPSVDIPASVTGIGERAFLNCYALTGVKIPDGVTSIKSETFSGCTSMTAISIPASVTRIEGGAFASCGLKDVYYGGSESQWNQIYIDSYLNDELRAATIHFGSAGSAPSTEPAPTTPDGIGVTVNGETVVWTDAAPFIDENNRTLVPLRAVADAMKLEVIWDAAAREASFTDGSKTIYFPIGSITARTSDGGTVTMDTAAVIANNRTYAPIRYLAQYFGYEVDWDAAARTVIIK